MGNKDSVVVAIELLNGSMLLLASMATEVSAFQEGVLQQLGLFLLVDV